MQWQELIEFLGGASAISLTIGYLGKKAIESYLSGRIEEFKSNLEKTNVEHSVRFQSLHSERAIIIKIFYKKLALLDDTLFSTLRPFQAVVEPTLEQKVNKLSEQFNDLRQFYLPHRIYFEKSTCESIETILEIAKGIFFDITTYPVDTQNPQCLYDQGILEERHQFWEQARNKHENEIKELKTTLECDFRKILGINYAQQNVQ